MKGTCKASMKNEYRQVKLNLSMDTGNVLHATCSCPAGLSGYCNHVMALLIELADYSLNQLNEVLDAISYTSKLCHWGIPSKHLNIKEPVMNQTIHKQYDKRVSRVRYLTHVLITVALIVIYDSRTFKKNLKKRIGGLATPMLMTHPRLL